MRMFGVMSLIMLMWSVMVTCMASGYRDGECRNPGEYLLYVSRMWRADSNGSKGMGMDVDIREFSDSLRQFARWKSDVVDLLGPPNRVRFVTYPEYVGSPEQAYTAYDYYIDQGCYRGGEVPCCSMYFATKPDGDSVLWVSMRCLD